MTKITAIVRADKLRAVENALREAKVPGFTYYDVKGHGREISKSTQVSVESGTEAAYVWEIVADVLPRVKFEVICDGNFCADIVGAVRKASATGERGDGIIYTEEIGTVVRILTGEEGEKAL